MINASTPVLFGRQSEAAPLSVKPGELDADEKQRRAKLNVALVSMPMAAGERPSLALGLLSAIANAHGFRAETIHAHLDFVSMLGYRTAKVLFRESQHQFAEWFFSKAAFGDEAPAGPEEVMAAFGDHIEWLAEQVAQSLGRSVGVEEILSVRDRLVPEYLDRVGSMVDWASFDVVGFTSTFQQNVASIAMARRLKALKPELVIVGGGANFEGEMGRELLRATPWFDYCVSGEADEVFPAFLAALSNETDPADITGVLSRDGDEIVGVAARQVRDMDALPTPDYDEFFERAERLSVVPKSARRELPIPYESSRGCWWGEKRHCTFCGLNGGSMEHRSKSPERVLRELSELTQRYGSFDLRATDNIMDERYFDELLPALIEAETDFDLFYEIKANLDRGRIEQLAKAGVRAIQPGIESLSSKVLRLMDKGIKASTNVNLLRWATHHQLTLSWNVLYGFPGEADEDYAIQAELAERLVHLHPPLFMGRLMMERFAPMFDDRERFPVKFIEPERGYAMVYPPSYDLDQLAYFFDYEFQDSLPEASYERLHKVVENWRGAWEDGSTPARLEMWRSPDVIHIEDHRDPATPVDWKFEGDLRSLYLACFDRPRSPRHVADELDLGLDAASIERVLDGFTERGLMMRDGNLFVALAIPPQKKRVELE